MGTDDGDAFAFQGGVLSLWAPTPFPGHVAYALLAPALAAAGVAAPDERTEATGRFRARRYACGEQHLRAAHAWLAGDVATLRAIQDTPDPSALRAVAARGARPPRAAWDRALHHLLVAGAVARLGTMARLEDELLATGSARIGFANRRDLALGTGLGRDDPGFRDPARWRGHNAYGRALEEARAIIARRRAGA